MELDKGTMLVLLAAVVAATTTFGWSVLAVRIGPTLGLVDEPDDPFLKAHRRPAVPLGGVGIFLAVHGYLALVGQFDLGLFVASIVVAAVGLADDLKSVRPSVRLLAETAAAFLLVLASPVMTGRGLVYSVLMVMLVIVSINAVNLFDGLDGLVGASGVIAGLGLWWLALSRGSDRTIGFGLAAALAGFLVKNWYQAKIFLGDHGSYLVGLFLAYGVITATPTESPADLVIAAGVLGVFSLDLAFTVLRRRLHRRPLFAGDRSHLYDQLVSRGFSVAQVVSLSALLEAGFVAVVLISDRILGGWAAVAMLCVAGFVSVAAAWAGGFVVESHP